MYPVTLIVILYDFFVVGFPSSNVHSYIASATPEHCTTSGIKHTFFEAAGKVGTRGMLVFHFTGHGIKVGDSGWGLAPVDFDYTKEHFITGQQMVDWLQGFQGRYVLIILDCCYAGGMAAEIAKVTATQEVPVSGLFVLTSCTADEASLVVSAVGHSIFNFFLTSVMHSNPSVYSGFLPINDVYEECNTCCQAFSSLLLSYDSRQDVLKWKMQQPEMKYFQVNEFVDSMFSSGEEETDAAEPNRLQFVMKYYNFEKCVLKKKPIDDKIMAWLEITRTALLELCTRGFLDNLHIRSACIASMMYSVASLFLALKQPELAEPNVFLIAFIHVAATIDHVHQELSLSKKDLKVALEYYASVLGSHKVKYKDLNTLYRSIVKDIVNEEMDIIKGEEATDSSREAEVST